MLAVMREVPLLAPLGDAELAELQGHCAWTWHQPGETVVRQGQAASDFYLVVHGRVELLLEGEVQTRLGLLGPGEFFGELPALTGDTAPATVVAVELSNLMRLSQEGLLLLLDRNPQLNRQIIATLAGRVKEAGARLHRARTRERSLSDHLARQGARTHPEWIGTGVWSQRVRAAITRGSRTLEPVVFVGEEGTGKELAAARMHYNSQRKDGPFITMDGANWTESGWGEALQLAAHGTLLLKRAHLAPGEAARAIRQILPATQAEARGGLASRIPRIMATADAADEREPSPVEEVLLEKGFAVPIPALRHRREDIPALVRHFLRRHGHRPQELGLQFISPEAMRRLESFPYLSGNVRELERVVQEAILLAGGSVIGLEHLRLSQRQRSSGRPTVGLALGGGVVRGCAHIGVLRALEEEGIPVDYLAGTSSGSLIGACWAGGMELSAMEALIARVGWLDIAEPCWPRGGFMTSRRMRSFLDRYIGSVAFDELRLPFAAVAADVNRGQEVILRQGRVADAVRASTAIPGVFRPVELDGRHLCDGVVVNNVPASVVRAMGADVVIAVDVTQYTFAPGPPRTIGDAIMRSFDIAARQSITASLEWADVVIHPPVGGLNGYSFKSAPEYVRRGYMAAREAMPAIRAQMDQVRADIG